MLILQAPIKIFAQNLYEVDFDCRKPSLDFKTDRLCGQFSRQQTNNWKEQ